MRYRDILLFSLIIFVFIPVVFAEGSSGIVTRIELDREKIWESGDSLDDTELSLLQGMEYELCVRVSGQYADQSVSVEAEDGMVVEKEHKQKSDYVEYFYLLKMEAVGDGKDIKITSSQSSITSSKTFRLDVVSLKKDIKIEIIPENEPYRDDKDIRFKIVPKVPEDDWGLYSFYFVAEAGGKSDSNDDGEMSLDLSDGVYDIDITVTYNGGVIKTVYPIEVENEKIDKKFSVGMSVNPEYPLTGEEVVITLKVVSDIDFFADVYVDGVLIEDDKSMPAGSNYIELSKVFYYAGDHKIKLTGRKFGEKRAFDSWEGKIYINLSSASFDIEEKETELPAKTEKYTQPEKTEQEKLPGYGSPSDKELEALKEQRERIENERQIPGLGFLSILAVLFLAAMIIKRKC